MNELQKAISNVNSFPSENGTGYVPFFNLTTRDAPAVDLSTRTASLTSTGAGIEATLSTGADVQRTGFIERLGTWAALPDRVPLLDSHRHGTVDAIVGYVDGLRSENGVLRGLVHISDSRPDIRAKIADGSISSTSIGFSAANWRESTEGNQRVRIADGITLCMKPRWLWSEQTEARGCGRWLRLWASLRRSCPR